MLTVKINDNVEFLVDQETISYRVDNDGDGYYLFHRSKCNDYIFDKLKICNKRIFVENIVGYTVEQSNPFPCVETLEDLAKVINTLKNYTKNVVNIELLQYVEPQVLQAIIKVNLHTDLMINDDIRNAIRQDSQNVQLQDWLDEHDSSWTLSAPQLQKYKQLVPSSQLVVEYAIRLLDEDTVKLSRKSKALFEEELGERMNNPEVNEWMKTVFFE